jgi:Zn-finger nucleic acid-binding protein
VIYVELKRCPNCGKVYEPELDRKHPEIVIQEEFPKAKPYQREQHITGLCSDECWNEYLGITERGEEK